MSSSARLPCQFFLELSPVVSPCCFKVSLIPCVMKTTMVSHSGGRCVQITHVIQTSCVPPSIFLKLSGITLISCYLFGISSTKLLRQLLFEFHLKFFWVKLLLIERSSSVSSSGRLPCQFFVELSPVVSSCCFKLSLAPLVTKLTKTFSCGWSRVKPPTSVFKTSFVAPPVFHKLLLHFCFCLLHLTRAPSRSLSVSCVSCWFLSRGQLISWKMFVSRFGEPSSRLFPHFCFDPGSHFRAHDLSELLLLLVVLTVPRPQRAPRGCLLWSGTCHVSFKRL